MSKYHTTRVNGKTHLTHRLIYEAHHGKIPKGCLIHHKNGDSRDNRKKNLGRETYVEHSRVHSRNYRRVNGTWLKRCGLCRKLKSLDQYYITFYRRSPRKGTPTSYCKECSRKEALERWHSLYHRKKEAV